MCCLSELVLVNSKNAGISCFSWICSDKFTLRSFCQSLSQHNQSRCRNRRKQRSFVASLLLYYVRLSFSFRLEENVCTAGGVLHALPGSWRLILSLVQSDKNALTVCHEDFSGKGKGSNWEEDSYGNGRKPLPVRNIQEARKVLIFLQMPFPCPHFPFSYCLVCTRKLFSFPLKINSLTFHTTLHTRNTHHFPKWNNKIKIPCHNSSLGLRLVCVGEGESYKFHFAGLPFRPPTQ